MLYVVHTLVINMRELYCAIGMGVLQVLHCNFHVVKIAEL
jgi:hypothetical protein